MDILNMKTDPSKKVVIKIASQEQQENAKNARKSLKVLQQAATDKENLVGRSRTEKDAKMIVDQEVKRKKVAHKSVQTTTVSAEDLTADEPSVDYWRKLAEKRREALDDSLQENERLKEHIDGLLEENRICKEMLEESKVLVEVLQDMIGNHDTSTEIAEEASEH